MLKKKGILTLSILLAALFLMSCAAPSETQPSSSETVTPEPSPTESIETVQLPDPIPVETPGKPEQIEYVNPDKIDVEYYDVNSDSTVKEEYDTTAGSNEQTPLDAVNQVFFGEDTVKANSIVLSNGNLFIDFDDSIYELREGSSLEGTLLEAIADAYLNNSDDIKAVYYSVNGNDYITGHIELDKGQPYKTKQ